MTTQELVNGLVRAMEGGDGALLASLFTEDGVYHDVFYGAFQGHARIAELVNDWVHRDCTDARWDMFDPVSDGNTLYIRYVFSYASKLPEAQGKRVGFEGVSIVRLKDGLITEYREIANTGPALLALGFSADRVAKILNRQGDTLRVRTDYARHRQ